jgi:hypothetical protein
MFAEIWASVSTDKFTKSSNAIYVNIKSWSSTVCLIPRQYRRGGVLGAMPFHLPIIFCVKDYGAILGRQTLPPDRRPADHHLHCAIDSVHSGRRARLDCRKLSHLWIIDAVVTWEMWWSPIYSHVGGFLIGLYAISKARATGRSWLPAMVWFVFLQAVTRYTTAPELNVNIAHFPYELVEWWFTSYWVFWPVCLLVTTGMVWIVEFGLLKLYPPDLANQAPKDTRLVQEESF